MTAAVEEGHHHLFQEGQIGLPLKILFLVQINETGVVETNGAEDLLCVPFPSAGNLRIPTKLSAISDLIVNADSISS